MPRPAAASKARRRVRATIAAGALAGLVGAALELSRRRARQRRDASEQEFSRASDGMWPTVPRAPMHSLRIEADKAATPADVADADSNDVAEESPA